MKLDKKQKQYAIIAGAALALFLLYRYYKGQQSATAAAGVPAPDTAGTDYAALAGQEQGDVASLQQQEQADIAALTAQESGDVATIGALIQGLAGGITGAQTQEQADMAALNAEIAALAGGHKKVDRTRIKTHKGGPFYKYYMKVTGHAPPAHVSTSNRIYKAWRATIKPHHTKPGHNQHPSSKNTNIAHPNHEHQPQTGSHRRLQNTNTHAPPRHHKATHHRHRR